MHQIHFKLFAGMLARTGFHTWKHTHSWFYIRGRNAEQTLTQFFTWNIHQPWLLPHEHTFCVSQLCFTQTHLLAFLGLQTLKQAQLH